MRILMLTSEVAPYAKTGGLGEVMGALPKAVHRLEHDVRVFTPLHGVIDRKKFAFVPIGQPQILNFDKQKHSIQFHASILSQEIPIYFFDSYEHFGQHKKKMYDNPEDKSQENLRFTLFNYSVFKLLETLDWVPDIIHCHDWHAALLPNIIASLPSGSRFKSIAKVQTIHNASFCGGSPKLIINADPGLGRVPKDVQKIYNINFLKRGVRNADIVTTVSQQYGKELLADKVSKNISPILRQKPERFFGVRNGVDYALFNPYYDQNIPVNYDIDLLHRKVDNKRSLQHQLGLKIDEKIPLLGMNTRITEQKGFSLVFEVFDDLMKRGVQFVVVGTGSGQYVKYFNKKMKQYPDQFAFRPYSERHGSLVYAGADIFLMPSLYEPAGLGQLISLRYGTIPVVRRTGGLADTIINYNSVTRSGNGFVFDDYTGEALAEAVDRALDTYKVHRHWDRLMRRSMALSYSWELPAKKYVRLYRAAMKQHNGQPWHIPSQWT